jgi:hypothetical protein
MSWIHQHRQELRAIILALLSLALIGPWMFDRIHVPAEYTCHRPNVRLYGDFCGVPLSGLRLLSIMVGGLMSTSKGLVTGSMRFSDWGREFVFSLLGLLILLPIFSTLLLVLRRDHRRLQVFNLTAWGLALGLCLLMGLSNYPYLFWALWGIWLYIALAASTLIIELFILFTGRCTSR